LAIAWINAKGIRESAVMVNTFALAKLAPLAVFIVIGMFFVQWQDLPRLPSAAQFGAGGLLLIYAFGGFETMGIPAGESSDPRKHLPFALITTLLIVTVILVAVQLISMSVLPNIATSSTPVADAALRFMGPAGALMIGIGSIVSMTGNVAGSLLAASRTLFALGENGSIPRIFAQVHPQSRAPTFAIWFSTFCAIALALGGSFATLALASAVTRLVTYIGVSAATLVLRGAKFEELLSPARFVLPLGPAIPWIAVLLSVALVAGASAAQLVAGVAVLTAGAALFWLSRLIRPG
jgi:amino acid transporter